MLTLSKQHFPQLSTELHLRSLEYSGFVYAFQKILQGLEESGSCVILLSVVAMAASESQHVCEDRIQQSLQTFIKRYYKVISLNSHYSLKNICLHVALIYMFIQTLFDKNKDWNVLLLLQPTIYLQILMNTLYFLGPV